ncbi:hypothetical protein [Sphingomonas sp. 3-13AW]|uniref:hypothetical protein n=1 Tax=Sphingomonas sp. 3-13AW TaxID=3050450 RepID=UPI003BB49F50
MVKTRSVIMTSNGEAIADARFSITLGTYSGPTTPKIMADNINARGVYEDDVHEVFSPAGAPPLSEAATLLSSRGILPDDIVDMAIEDVLIDDTVIASSFVHTQL